MPAYTLTGVDLLIYPSIPPGTNDTEPDYTVSVWSSGTDGDPGGNLGTLTNPASLINGTNTLASSTGIHLEAGTTYFLVFEASRRGNRDPYIQLTASDDEDAGAGAGWSIATAALARFKTGGSLGRPRPTARSVGSLCTATGTGWWAMPARTTPVAAASQTTTPRPSPRAASRRATG